MAERHAINQIPRALIELGYNDAPNYRAVYAAALNGQIPAQQGRNLRWTFDLADMPAIIAGLGLEPLAEIAA